MIPGLYNGGFTMIDPWMDSVVSGVGSGWSPFTSAISQGVTIGNGFLDFDPSRIYRSGYGLGGGLGGFGGGMNAFGGGLAAMMAAAFSGPPLWAMLFMDPDAARAMFGLGGNNQNAAAGTAAAAAGPAAPTAPQAAPTPPSSPTSTTISSAPPATDPGKPADAQNPTTPTSNPPDGNTPTVPPKVRRVPRRPGPQGDNVVKSWTKEQREGLKTADEELQKLVQNAPAVFQTKFEFANIVPAANGVLQVTLTVKGKETPTKENVTAVLNYFNNKKLGVLTLRVQPDANVQAIQNGATPAPVPTAPTPTPGAPTPVPPAPVPGTPAGGPSPENLAKAKRYKSNSTAVTITESGGKFTVSYPNTNAGAKAAAENDVAQLKKLVGAANVIGPNPK